MKRILLLGDSIREGYEPYVRERLAGLAEVVAPAENGRFSFYTLWGVNLWMKELGTPDIVHWNNGLWDVHREAPRDELLTPVIDYVTNLKRIAHEVRGQMRILYLPRRRRCIRNPRAEAMKRLTPTIRRRWRRLCRWALRFMI